ncbi:hypothetical protein RRG08_037210 [Elysia crispata]|uniref:Uncharacterized protein n=1 Tax=Elysia crispata TaxID=231223 RepID=A0AAE0Z4S0_9GAST|nr:hypothetical protein RRG08_037210 [Elysia crispata]
MSAKRVHLVILGLCRESDDTHEVIITLLEFENNMFIDPKEPSIPTGLKDDQNWLSVTRNSRKGLSSKNKSLVGNTSFSQNLLNTRPRNI